MQLLALTLQRSLMPTLMHESNQGEGEAGRWQSWALGGVAAGGAQSFNLIPVWTAGGAARSNVLTADIKQVSTEKTKCAIQPDVPRGAVQDWPQLRPVLLKTPPRSQSLSSASKRLNTSFV